MAEFIAPELKKQTLSGEQYKSKLQLRKNEVTLNFLETKDSNGTFRINYIVQVNPKGRRLDPQVKMSPSVLDMQSLREAILSNIPPFDRKYMILRKFDDKKAFFDFNHEKWLKDATKGMKGKNYYSKFDREFKFKIQPPKAVSKDRLTIKFEKFITRKFLDWLENKKTKQKDFFKFLIPKKEQRKIRTKIINMFDWHYDSQWNRMVASLKSIYIIALIYATGSMIKKLSRRNINKSQKKLFSDRVKSNIKDFDRKRWEEFTKKKFF